MNIQYAGYQKNQGSAFTRQVQRYKMINNDDNQRNSERTPISIGTLPNSEHKTSEKRTKKEVQLRNQESNSQNTTQSEDLNKVGQLTQVKQLRLQYRKTIKKMNKVRNQLKIIRDAKLNQLKSNINLIQEVNNLKSQLRQKEDLISALVYEKQKMNEQINGNKKNWHNSLGSKKTLKQMEDHCQEIKKEIKKIKIFEANLIKQSYDSSDYIDFLTKKVGVNLTKNYSNKLINKELKELIENQKLNFLNTREEVRILKNILDKEVLEHHKTSDKLKKEINNLLIILKQKELKLRQLISKPLRMYSESRLLKAQSCRNLTSHNKTDLFVGNKLLLDKAIKKIDPEKTVLQILTHIVFFMKDNRQIMFQCRYAEQMCGILHSKNEFIECTEKQTIINIRQITKLKVFYKNHISGLQIGLKNSDEIIIGLFNAQDFIEQIQLKDKKIISISSYWHKGLLIGLGFIYKYIQKMRSRQQNISKFATNQYYV